MTCTVAFTPRPHANDGPPNFALTDKAARNEHLRLFRTVQQELGPAAQTLAGLYLVASVLGQDGETFASVASRKGSDHDDVAQSIAEAACLPLRTVRSHLQKLLAGGWIENLGRDPLGPNTKRTRRTCRIRLTEKAIKAAATYALLPRWAADMLRTDSERRVFAFVVSQFEQARRSEVEELADDELPENGRDQINLASIARNTGLSLKSVRTAVASLAAVDESRVVSGPLLSVENVETQNGPTTFVWLNRETLVPSAVFPRHVGSKKKPDHAQVELFPDPMQALTDPPLQCPDGMTPAPDAPLENPALDPGKNGTRPGKILHSTLVKMALDPGKNGTPLEEEPVGKNLLVRTCEEEPAETNVASDGFDHSCLSSEEPTKTCSNPKDPHALLVDEEQDYELASTVYSILGPRLKADDTGSVVWKAACWIRLVDGISPADLLDAAYATTKRPKEIGAAPKGFGYFVECLQERLGLLGLSPTDVAEHFEMAARYHERQDLDPEQVKCLQERKALGKDRYWKLFYATRFPKGFTDTVHVPRRSYNHGERIDRLEPVPLKSLLARIVDSLMSEPPLVILPTPRPTTDDALCRPASLTA